MSDFSDYYWLISQGEAVEVEQAKTSERSLLRK